jgi:predicted RND superfamily exporter protein
MAGKRSLHARRFVSRGRGCYRGDNMSSRSRLEAVCARIIAWRVSIVVLFAVLVPLAIWQAQQLRSSAAIGGLVVVSDPDYVATKAFEKIFPESAIVLLLLEFDDPYQPAALATVDAVTHAARSVPGVTVFSALEVYRRAHPGFQPAAQTAGELKRFITGADALRRQGLWGKGFLGVGVAFPARGAEARDHTLAALDAALAGVAKGPLLRMRKVGAPYLESWIERESREAQLRGFPLFALMVMGFAFFLYRSWRALLAILLSLAASVALAMGAGHLLGYGITVVSALVPLTVLVTTLASLVYVHSRYVDQLEPNLEAHHLIALRDKFLPVTASSVAAVLGFAALVVSPIRPVREMGIWTALSLAIGWIVTFTLFPALQRMLRTPTGQEQAVRSRLYDKIASVVPGLSYRHRWLLLITSLALSALGLVALLGIPGVVAGVNVSVEGLDYVDHELQIHRDMTFFRDNVSGLNAARVWVQVPDGTATEPEVLRGIDRFMTSIQAMPMVSSVVGPTTFLRMREYVAGHGAQLPLDAAGFARIAADTESLLLTERELRGFIDVNSLSNLQLTVTFRRGPGADYDDLKRDLNTAWAEATRIAPALREATIQVVGESMLQAKVGKSLVPTLTESFAITAVLIFAAFLMVFRSPSARLMAMIPSLFAILVTFLGLRLVGGSLNVATILIATTVLGTTENDQIHFFYHLQEVKDQPFEAQLQHALRVSGRAIFFATVINATGFMGLAFSNFPPLRQFGVETAVAFALAMLADFTALPAALWIVHKQKPASEPR